MATNVATEEVADALLRSISHNLRTPLTSIQGALSYLQEDAAQHAAPYQTLPAHRSVPLRRKRVAPQEPFSLQDEARRDLIENAVTEAERLNRFIGNLLDMARLEAGVVRLIPTLGSVEDVIGVALDRLRETLRGRRVHIHVARDIPPVPMDFPWLVKALVHVLDNAARYSPAGTPIQIRTRTRGEYLEITVADRGVGMSPEDLTRVFEKFYRIGRAEEASGTGVGLAICKAILAGHGGSIRAEERRGGGAVITMILPLLTLAGS